MFVRFEGYQKGFPSNCQFSGRSSLIPGEGIPVGARIRVDLKEERHSVIVVSGIMDSGATGI